MFQLFQMRDPTVSGQDLHALPEEGRVPDIPTGIRGRQSRLRPSTLLKRPDCRPRRHWARRIGNLSGRIHTPHNDNTVA